MERMPDFRRDFNERGFHSQKSFLESSFGLNTNSFERTVGFKIEELQRFEYNPLTATFNSVSQNTRRRSTEVLLTSDGGTMVVPPPTPGRPVTMAELAAMTLPVVDYIGAQNPDIVIGCDRGARIYSFAVYSMWQRRQRERFPTLNGDINYARLSTSLAPDVVTTVLHQVIKNALQEGERQNHPATNPPKIMFIDDWISSGATRRHILGAIKEMGILDKVDIRFVVMCGEGADATGATKRVHIPWHDDPNVIGVNYDANGCGVAVRTEESRNIRYEVRQEVRKVARKLRTAAQGA